MCNNQKFRAFKWKVLTTAAVFPHVWQLSHFSVWKQKILCVKKVSTKVVLTKNRNTDVFICVDKV